MGDTGKLKTCVKHKVQVLLYPHQGSYKTQAVSHKECHFMAAYALFGSSPDYCYFMFKYIWLQHQETTVCSK